MYIYTLVFYLFKYKLAPHQGFSLNLALSPSTPCSTISSDIIRTSCSNRNDVNALMTAWQREGNYWGSTVRSCLTQYVNIGNKNNKRKQKISLRIMDETFESWVTEAGVGVGLLISYSEHAFKISKLHQASPIIHDTFEPLSSNASWNWLSKPPSASWPAGANSLSGAWQQGRGIRRTQDAFCPEVRAEKKVEFVRSGAMRKSLQLQATGPPPVPHDRKPEGGSYLAPCFRTAIRRGLPKYRRGQLPISARYWHCPTGHFRSIWCPVATGAER